MISLRCFRGRGGWDSRGREIGAKPLILCSRQEGHWKESPSFNPSTTTLVPFSLQPNLQLTHGIISLPPSRPLQIHPPRTPSPTPLNAFSTPATHPHHLLNLVARLGTASRRRRTIHPVRKGTEDVCHLAGEIQSGHVNG